jgi:tetratricopeptide (TPR) repeat protein
MGVKAVVAAGWAVDDAAAETFATSFYRHLLASDKFGDAVRAAREETFDGHGATNTWGAYQCYGDPAFRLRSRKQQKKGDEKRSYVSPAQVVMDLENLANRARSGADCGSDVEAVVQAVREKKESWLKQHDVAAALGLAYGELGLFAQAIEHLNTAIEKEKADYPMRILEQRANFKSRWALELKRGGMSKTVKSSPEELIQRAIDDLDRLLKFNRTAERLSLLGSAYKRRAWIATGDERKEALSKMAEFYQEAHTNNDKHNMLDTYPLLNWLAAEILCGWYGVKREIKGKPPNIRELCEKAGAYAEEKDRQEPSFWNSVVQPECNLVQALATGTLEKQKDAIIEAYRRAKARGASPREFRSVTEHLEFLVDLAEGAGKRKEIQRQAAVLREIVGQLAPLAKE